MSETQKQTATVKTRTQTIIREAEQAAEANFTQGDADALASILIRMRGLLIAALLIVAAIFLRGSADDADQIGPSFISAVSGALAYSVAFGLVINFVASMRVFSGRRETEAPQPQADHLRQTSAGGHGAGGGGAPPGVIVGQSMIDPEDGREGAHIGAFPWGIVAGLVAFMVLILNEYFG